MNWNMIGHDWAVRLLQQHVREENHRQAYLITGPESIGKTSIALRFAQALNCPKINKNGDPCFNCRTCTLIDQMNHPDLTVIEAESPGAQLRVDQIRGLQHGLSLAPYEAKYRVGLLLRFEEANQQAANALLKTLEEPPRQVILILTASSPDVLLPTIVSRCEHIRLRPVATETVKHGLQTKFNLSSADVDVLAHLSSGRPGYSVQLHLDPGKFEHRKTSLDQLIKLLVADRVERFEYAERLAKDGKASSETLKIWLGFWHDVLLKISDSSSQITNLDYSEQIEKISESLGYKQSLSVVQGMERVFNHLAHNVNPRLALEVFMLDLPYHEVEIP